MPGRPPDPSIPFSALRHQRGLGGGITHPQAAAVRHRPGASTTLSDAVQLDGAPRRRFQYFRRPAARRAAPGRPPRIRDTAFKRRLRPAPARHAAFAARNIRAATGCKPASSPNHRSVACRPARPPRFHSAIPRRQLFCRTWQPGPPPRKAGGGILPPGTPAGRQLVTRRKADARPPAVLRSLNFRLILSDVTIHYKIK